MNKLAVISAFLGKAANRYMQYQGPATLDEKFAKASKINTIDGLELCYPDDFEDVAHLKELLGEHNLGVAAINFRSRRTGKWWRGSFTSTIASERAEVVDEMKRAMDYAAEIGGSRITTCPLNDGVDTVFEADYRVMFDGAVQAFSQICAHNRSIKICIEYKRNDPMTRCFFGNAGETAAFCGLVGADNLGATLDIGHSLLSNERPAQAAVLLARTRRLFYVHLNDNDGFWDWDLLPGAFHLWEFVELFYYLRELGYDNDWYAFDVFPKEADVVKNFSAAFALTRKLEEITNRIDKGKMKELLQNRTAHETLPYLYSVL